MYLNDGRTSYAPDQTKELLNALYALEPKTQRINTPEDAVVHFLKYRCRKVEYFFSLSVDNKNNLIKRHELFRGTVDQSAVYAQEVLKATLRCDGSGIVIGHNHPSGDPSPSNQDIELTRKLKEACNTVGFRLLDHLIVSKFGHHSFQEHDQL